MSAEEFMLDNIRAIRALNPLVWGWVYVRAPLPGLRTPCTRSFFSPTHPPARPHALRLKRNGIKALPWHTTVRKLLEDRAQWGLFMPLAGCMPEPGEYVCGPNATQNLYHDFEQTPKGDCGVGVECGEYVCVRGSRRGGGSCRREGERRGRKLPPCQPT
jgi:hypothetical protein